MNRVIKFRAWVDIWGDGRLGMLDPYPGNYGVDMGGKGMFHNTGNPMGLREYPSGAILMQFTGLTDKNGKEIYEGDVLRCWEDRGEMASDLEHRLEVKWSEDLMWVAYSKDDEYGDTLCSMHPEELEVIGNIYQNPDLVEKNV